MPGFVDTHWHLWTSLLRPFVRADVNELGYFPVSNRLGQLYTAEDSYRSVLLGVAEALSAGVTTVHNWAHNVRSPDHADAELSAMRDAGIRGRFAYGPAQGCQTISDGPRWPGAWRDWCRDGRRTRLNWRALAADRWRGAGTIRRYGEAGWRRTGTRATDHDAHLRPEPDKADGGGRAARP
jgi:cytosine/adenosine deaminase-related metal-dependent hydrolase